MPGTTRRKPELSLRQWASCSLCDYYDALNGDDFGHCRRHAPVPDIINTTSKGATWPLVAETDWCGDYKPALSVKQPKLPLRGAMR